MDYSAIAIELLEKLKTLRLGGYQRNLDEYLQGEKFVLCYIALRTGNTLPSDISREMNVSSARIAVALNSLESKGLVTRQINTNDRRQILVTVTKKGRDQAGEIYQNVLEHITEFLSLLGEADAKEYLRITKKLADIAISHNRRGIKKDSLEDCFEVTTD